MMKLAIVVVLHDPGTLAIRPVEQGKPAVDRQCHTERKLMGWCDQCERGVWGAPDGGSDVQSSIIDFAAHQPQRSVLEQIPGEEITGILDQNLGAGLEQRLNNQAESTLEPGGDQDLVGGACDIPRDSQITRNGTPQRLVPHDVVQIGIRHLLAVELPRNTRGDPGPSLARECIQRWRSHPK